MSEPKDPYDWATLGNNGDGTHDVMVRLTVRLIDEVGQRSEAHMLEAEHEFEVSTEGTVVVSAVRQAMSAAPRDRMMIERAHIFAGNGATGDFQSPAG